MIMQNGLGATMLTAATVLHRHLPLTKRWPGAGSQRRALAWCRKPPTNGARECARRLRQMNRRRYQPQHDADAVVRVVV